MDDETEKLQESDLQQLMKHKNVILNFVEQIESRVLVAIVISNCNGSHSHSFTDAYVEHSRTGSYVYYKTLFKIEIIKHIMEKERLPEDLGSSRSLVVRSLTLLARYLSELDHNQEVLEKYAEDQSTSEVEWSGVLSSHLFKKLAPVKNATLNDVEYSDLKNCPCNCGARIDIGDTSLGNASVWHGTADVICDDVIIEVEDTFPDSITDDTSNIEGEKNVKSNHKDQILATSIVASFASKRPSPLMTVTKKDIQLFMYIPEGDILLEGAPFFLILGNKVMVTGILFLWLILNYNSFKEDLSKTIRYGMQTSNFKTLIGDKLEVYETSVCFRCKKKYCDYIQAKDFFSIFKAEKAVCNFSEK